MVTPYILKSWLFGLFTGLQLGYCGSFLEFDYFLAFVLHDL